jgi:NADH-quinone oxidoreductase subunit G
MKGDDVLRVSARKDKNEEIEEFICNECRFEKKKKEDWVIEKPTHISRQSVISQNHYEVSKPLKLGTGSQPPKPLLNTE